MTKDLAEHTHPDSLDNRIQHWAISLMQVSLLVAVVYGAFTFRWELLFMSLLALILTGLPIVIKRHYSVSLPVEYDFLIVVFIYASIFLGEVGGAYERFWWWDVLLHSSSGLVLGFVGFLILYILYDRRKIHASALILASFVFSFGLAMGAVWEIFEFVMDSLFGLNMQKNGLKDTMADLIVDGLGSMVVAWAAYRYAKYDSPNLFAKLIRSFLKQNPKIEQRWRQRRVSDSGT